MIHLKAELIQDLKTVHGVRTALQQAVMLEHATIPTYLYALYSIKPGGNQEIAALIRSVVIEEMTHMAMAANILNAIKGTPIINRPDFVPKYPGPLPGGVDTGLTVPLSPLSLELVKDTFMAIEEPEHPIDFEMRAAAGSITIGRFYTAISAALADLEAEAREKDKTIFDGDQANQVAPDHWGIVEVTDLTSAQAAITKIIDEGEGTSTSPLDGDIPSELAHYYRFEEIHRGRQLIPDPNAEKGYSFTGPRIPFDPAHVRPVISNPSQHPYPGGSAAHVLNTTFNYTYTSMLNSLHNTFNGHPGDIIAAVGLMEACKQLADELMNVDLGNGTTAGPSFEFQPTNP